jgi:hypothetical protein
MAIHGIDKPTFEGLSISIFSNAPLKGAFAANLPQLIASEDTTCNMAII